MNKVVLLVLASVCLSGCIQHPLVRADIAARAKTQLVGMSSQDLLLCAGVPARTMQSAGLEFWTYASGGDASGHVSGGGYGPARVSLHKYYCEVTVVLSQGRVQQVRYAGNTGNPILQGEQCAYALEHCVRPAQGQR
jgi:hypothetical protein